MRILVLLWSSLFFDLSNSNSMDRSRPESPSKRTNNERLRQTPPPTMDKPGEVERNKRRTAASGGSGSGSGPACQAERCTADLAEAKRYHRRHKVCEEHSKAAAVMVAGLRQRFCQQCSRFHELVEFDDTKRSCRRRLAGHNERRRKGAAEAQGEGSSRCNEADQDERIQIGLSGKHFQIR